jgi:hypothetical protein
MPAGGGTARTHGGRPHLHTPAGCGTACTVGGTRRRRITDPHRLTDGKTPRPAWGSFSYARPVSGADLVVEAIGGRRIFQKRTEATSIVPRNVESHSTLLWFVEQTVHSGSRSICGLRSERNRPRTVVRILVDGPTPEVLAKAFLREAPASAEGLVTRVARSRSDSRAIEARPAARFQRGIRATLVIRLLIARLAQTDSASMIAEKPRSTTVLDRTASATPSNRTGTASPA